MRMKKTRRDVKIDSGPAQRLHVQAFCEQPFTLADQSHYLLNAIKGQQLFQFKLTNNEYAVVFHVYLR